MFREGSPQHQAAVAFKNHLDTLTVGPEMNLPQVRVLVDMQRAYTEVVSPGQSTGLFGYVLSEFDTGNTFPAYFWVSFNAINNTAEQFPLFMIDPWLKAAQALEREGNVMHEHIQTPDQFYGYMEEIYEQLNITHESIQEAACVRATLRILNTEQKNHLLGPIQEHIEKALDEGAFEIFKRHMQALTPPRWDEDNPPSIDAMLQNLANRTEYTLEDIRKLLEARHIRNRYLLKTMHTDLRTAQGFAKETENVEHALKRWDDGDRTQAVIIFARNAAGGMLNDVPNWQAYVDFIDALVRTPLVEPTLDQEGTFTLAMNQCREMIHHFKGTEFENIIPGARLALAAFELNYAQFVLPKNESAIQRLEANYNQQSVALRQARRKE